MSNKGLAEGAEKEAFLAAVGFGLGTLLFLIGLTIIIVGIGWMMAGFPGL